MYKCMYIYAIICRITFIGPTTRIMLKFLFLFLQI